MGLSADIQASQRATAKALGVGEATIRRDVKPDAPHDAPEPKTPIENQEVTNGAVTNVTPEPPEEVGMVKKPTA